MNLHFADVLCSQRMMGNNPTVNQNDWKIFIYADNLALFISTQFCQTVQCMLSKRDIFMSETESCDICDMSDECHPPHSPCGRPC